MTQKALGLIEVKGYLGAVVAADAALKAANVSLLNIETVKSGLNTVQLIGDVSAVRSAVDAAVEAVQDHPYYLTSHVISRLDNQTKVLFSGAREEKQEYHVEVAETAESQEIPTKIEKKSSEERSPKEATSLTIKYKKEELEKMKVVDLRSIAYREETVGLSKKEIKFANKLRLIEALTNL
ncbi:energy-coupling factor transport system substrate-specific component [Streptococcus rupicaprae]|uniref:Energy-coupling factor transport system substrate-specific component n=1 Tax=Streptococcus rupicaprae TaxID=759619 RepID=A0ABV2FF32_9STRE